MQDTENTYDSIIIGGGASGLFSAGILAQSGLRVLLIEKNAELGKKLSISGGGRCNITNAEFDTRTFLSHFPQAHKFLASPFSQFSVQETFDYFEEKGLPLVVEARKRAFPKTQKATDVVRVLEKDLHVPNVTIMKSTAVSKFTYNDEEITGVTLKDDTYIRSNTYILATGGAAAPETGSTGDGFAMLTGIGHTVHKPNPNVVPLKTNASWVHKLSGTTYNYCEIRFVQNNKTEVKKRGKILFTHFGISGPLILNSSYEVSELLAQGHVHAQVNLFPDLNEAQLDAKVTKLFSANKNKKLRNVLPELLPKQLAHAILHLVGGQIGEVSVHSITKEERKKLVKTMQSLGFPITGTMGLNRAVIVDGGVDLTEVDFKSMRSKKFRNLYLLGDILNINRPSGGYSLQLCWTTGWVAAKHILQTLTKG